MSVLARSNGFAVYPTYYTQDASSGTIRHYSQSIASLLPNLDGLCLSKIGVSQYLNKAPDGIQTCYANIKKLSPHQQLTFNDNGYYLSSLSQYSQPVVPSTDITALLIHELLKTIKEYNHCALALSGGLDSTLILSLLKEASIDIDVYTLATDFTDYCELENTQRIADFYGVKLNIITANAEDFISALPHTIMHTETPLYNLHPVSKLLLARALKQRGVDCIITGDAADQAFAGTSGKNYIPLVGSIMKGENIGYSSPFFNDDIIAYGLNYPDANKSALRKMSQSRVPDFIHKQKKQPRLAPDFDLSRYFHEKNILTIAQSLDLTPNFHNAASKTLWTTLSMLHSQLSNVHSSANVPTILSNSLNNDELEYSE